MGKLLFWAILILAALIVARMVSHKAARRNMPSPASGRGTGGQAEAMVRCAHCGVHLPRSEALLLDGQLWCSEEHARLGSSL